MKLRIKDSTIRIRLSMGDVRQLAEAGSVVAFCVFPGGARLGYGINRAKDWHTEFTEGDIRVYVPEEVLDNFCNTDRVGFDHRIENGVPGGLYLLIEKDFQCLTERLHEDESDLFPNPNANC